MSSAATRNDRAVDAARHPEPQIAFAQPPPKLRRRPGVIAAAVAAICLGALVTAWAWTSTTHTHEVLAARVTIARGAVIEAGNLTRLRINDASGLATVPAADADQIIGRRAALDIAAGGLLTTSSTTSAVIPANGSSVVGVALTPAQIPGIPLQAGDHVRVVVTPPAGAAPQSGAPQTSDAEVVDVQADPTTGGTVVDLLVAESDAAVVAARVATGNVALVLDTRER